MNYQVKWQGAEVPVRTATVYPSPYRAEEKMEYVQFPWHKAATLRVCSAVPVRSAIVRPAGAGIAARIADGVIELEITRPAKLSLEINGSTENNLLILPEEGMDAPAPEGTNVVCFPEGVREAGIVTIDRDDTIVYFAPGAYVHGKLTLSGCSRVTVCGYGVLSMERYPYESRPVYARCIDAVGCRDLVIRDLTIMDSNDWSLRVMGCEDVLVDNVKIFGCRGNSDGVDVCGSRRVTVQNVFTRVWDDSLVVKALDTGDAEDITFRHCVLWNDFARPMEVGVELRADRVHRVKFEDIDVLHMPTGYPVMGIHHGDRAVVSDITFENIRIEDAPGAQLFDLRITPSYWNRDTKMGCIRDVTFRNIRVLGAPGLTQLMSDSRVEGWDEKHNICGVTVENIDLCGKTPASAEALGIRTTPFARGVKVIPHPSLEPVRLVETKVRTAKEFELREDGLYEGEIEIVLNSFAGKPVEKEVWLRLSPETDGGSDPKPEHVRLEPGGECVLSYPLVLAPGRYLAAVQSRDPEIAYSWLFFRLDWNLAHGGVRRFVNYRGEGAGPVRMRAEADALVLESPILREKGSSLVLYAALPVPCERGEAVFSVEETDYGRSPAILNGARGLEAAPQMRCPLEITMVFRAQPKTETVTYTAEGGGDGTARIPLALLGIPGDAKEFLLEIEARTPAFAGQRCPMTLFRSPSPQTSAHMFCRCLLENGEAEE